MKNRAYRKLVAKTMFLMVFIMALALSGIPSPALAEDADAVFEALQMAKHKERLETSDFTLPTIDGEEKSLTDYKGSVILLNFWTTW